MTVDRYSKRSTYYGIIKPYRQDFMTNPNDKENQIMSAHFAYLKQLIAEVKLLSAGPTLIEEDPFGLYIILADSEKEARELVKKDPSVLKGVQNNS